MIGKEELTEWLATLRPGSGIAVDDGGLCLLAIHDEFPAEDSFLEVGGVPLEEDEAADEDAPPRVALSSDSVLRKYFKFAPAP